MDFSKALEAMKTGKKISRKGLYGLDISLEVYPGGIHKTIALTRNDGTKQLNYKVDSSDLLAEDWEIIDETLNDTTLDPEPSRLIFSNISTLEEDFHISLPSMGIDKTLKAGSWTIQQDIYPMKTVLEFIELDTNNPQKILNNYRKWLETAISDWKAQIEICVSEKQYTSAGEFENNVRILERCLEKLDLISNEQNN